jgi:hypothetical protein
MSGLTIDTFPSILGGGIPGGQPKGGLIGLMEGGGDRGMFRLIMRNSFGRNVGNQRHTDNKRKPSDASYFTRIKQVDTLTKTYNDSKF